jgi:4-carboxymuconolactone decarboxylase
MSEAHLMACRQHRCVPAPIAVTTASERPGLTICGKDGNLLAKYENMILMNERRCAVRVPPLPANQWDDEVDQALAVMLPQERRNPANASNILSTFVRHPALTKEFLRFNVHLLFHSTLPPRLRELAILRVAHRTGSGYEWAQHVKMGLREGLTEDEITGVQRPAEFPAADEFDRTVLAGVDELMDSYELSDATWSALSERLDERQRMDFVFTIGCYITVAMALKTFGIELDQER